MRTRLRLVWGSDLVNGKGILSHDVVVLHLKVTQLLLENIEA